MGISQEPTKIPTLLMNLHETSDELIEEATKIRFVNFQNNFT